MTFEKSFIYRSLYELTKVFFEINQRRDEDELEG